MEYTDIVFENTKLFGYGNRARPPHNFMPKWEKYDPDGAIEGRKRDSYCRHGIVYYKERLTEDQIKKFELMPFGDDDRIKNIVTQLKKDRHIPKYIELMKDSPDIKEELIRNILNKITLHPSEIEDVITQLQK